MSVADELSIRAEHQHNGRDLPGSENVAKSAAVLGFKSRTKLLSFHHFKGAAGIKVRTTDQSGSGGVADLNLLDARKTAKLLLFRIVITVVILKACDVGMSHRVKFRDRTDDRNGERSRIGPGNAGGCIEQSKVSRRFVADPRDASDSIGDAVQQVLIRTTANQLSQIDRLDLRFTLAV